MKIAIISIGNELLEGRILNTNAQYVCKKLYQAGYLPNKQTSILDHPQVIIDKIRSSLEEHDVLIFSGGLGPTQDDLTLQAAADFFNSKLTMNDVLLNNLKRRFGKKLDLCHLTPFALVPEKAELLLDHCGMAPGFMFKKGKKRILFLPGVPHEFCHLVDKEVVPLLKKNFPIKTSEYQRVIHLCLVPESETVPMIDQLLLQHPKVDFGIYPHFRSLSIHVKMKGPSKKSVDPTLVACISHIKKKYPKKYFLGDNLSLPEAVHKYLIRKKMTLSCAESCTGGALSATLTQFPNASTYFKGSVVSYSNEAKKHLLKVKESTLTNEGAVSAQCVDQMALGAQKLFKTDVSFAVSGIAGPTGGTRQKPVGTVLAAIAMNQKIIGNFSFKFSGDRSTIIQRSIHNILAQFWINRDNL